MGPTEVRSVRGDESPERFGRRRTGPSPGARGSLGRVVGAFDRQRQLLGRDLHDGLQQRLVAMRIRLALATELAGEDARLREMLEDMGDSVDAAIQELREVSEGIHPHLLSRYGMVAALEQVAHGAGTAVRVRGGGVGRHPAELELAVYYCCREAIQNASKHSGPTVQIVVSLREDAHTVGFDVSDDGPGFDLSASFDGTGLQHMRDRIDAVGGELSILSRIGGGTVVTASIPRR